MPSIHRSCISPPWGLSVTRSITGLPNSMKVPPYFFPFKRSQGVRPSFPTWHLFKMHSLHIYIYIYIHIHIHSHSHSHSHPHLHLHLHLHLLSTFTSTYTFFHMFIHADAARTSTVTRVSLPGLCAVRRHCFFAFLVVPTCSTGQVRRARSLVSPGSSMDANERKALMLVSLTQLFEECDEVACAGSGA